MAISAASQLLDAIRQAGLLEKAQLDELTRRPSQADARALAKELLDRGWLTAYQINQLLNADGRGLVLGPYVLLDRLGEGGMGQVFKARHRGLQRLVALKLIRQEFVADAETIGRFYREMQVTSKLAHPNVVKAYDAGPVGSAHALAMEYIEGTDLEHLVKKSGPLPVAQAGDFIRQAALGLQHIHEHGLVHRDIKPQNLILSKPGPQGTGLGQIKILDLGLARLQDSVHG